RLMEFRRIMRVDDVPSSIALRLPLMSTGRGLRQLPVEAEQRVEIAVVPCGGVRLPRALDARRDGVTGHAAFEGGNPAKTLVFNLRAFRLESDVVRGACAMRLAEGVTAGNQCHGFFIV